MQDALYCSNKTQNITNFQLQINNFPLLSVSYFYKNTTTFSSNNLRLRKLLLPHLIFLCTQSCNSFASLRIYKKLCTFSLMRSVFLNVQLTRLVVKPNYLSIFAEKTTTTTIKNLFIHLDWFSQKSMQYLLLNTPV